MKTSPTLITKLDNGVNAFDIVTDILIRSQDNKIKWKRLLPQTLRFLAILGNYSITYTHVFDTHSTLEIWEKELGGSRLIMDINVKTEVANFLFQSILKQMNVEECKESHFIDIDESEAVERYCKFIEENP